MSFGPTQANKIYRWIAELRNAIVGGVGIMPDSAPLTHAPQVTAVMGNAVPLIIVPANPNRRELSITNCSAAVARLSWGNGGVGLTLTEYPLRLAVNQTLIFTPPLDRGDLWAICGAGGQNVVYQEAT